MVVPLYLDENVSERLIDALLPLGIDAVSSNRVHKGATDGEQLLIARRLNRVLVTTNTDDFLLLHQAWRAWGTEWFGATRPLHAGIFMLHSSPGFGVDRVALLIQEVMKQFEEHDGFEDRAFSWNRTEGWHER